MCVAIIVKYRDYFQAQNINHNLGWTVDVIMTTERGFCVCRFYIQHGISTSWRKDHLTYGLGLAVLRKHLDSKP